LHDADNATAVGGFSVLGIRNAKSEPYTDPLMYIGTNVGYIDKLREWVSDHVIVGRLSLLPFNAKSEVKTLSGKSGTFFNGEVRLNGHKHVVKVSVAEDKLSKYGPFAEVYTVDSVLVEPPRVASDDTKKPVADPKSGKPEEKPGVNIPLLLGLLIPAIIIVLAAVGVVLVVKLRKRRRGYVAVDVK
jgi:hypothetical protein